MNVRHSRAQGHLIIGNLHLESLNVKTQLVVGWVVEIMIYKVL